MTSKSCCKDEKADAPYLKTRTSEPQLVFSDLWFNQNIGSFVN
jgi:hypothetical protein